MKTYLKISIFFSASIIAQSFMLTNANAYLQQDYTCITEELNLAMKHNIFRATRHNIDLDFDGKSDYYRSKTYYKDNTLVIDLFPAFETNYILEDKETTVTFDGTNFSLITDTKSDNIFSNNSQNLEIINKENNMKLIIISDTKSNISFLCSPIKNNSGKYKSKDIVKKVFNRK
jgi:hypothetical protein